ncbi:MAG TPA: ABC-2 family transporter protein [Candidatus Obscuribacterales bacterium]
MRFWQKYPAVGLASARSNLAYLGEVTSRVIFLGIILYIFLRLWKVTFTQAAAQQLGGFTLEQMLWYLAVTESIMLSAPRVAQLVDEDVRTGALSVQLIRPMSYPLYRLWTTLGERLVRFLVNSAVAAAVVCLLVGPIKWSLPGLLIFVLSLPLAFALDFLGNFLVGLGAFWLEDTTGLLLIYSRVTMIMGGMLIPLELLPDAIRTAFQTLPFASMVYGPAKLFVHPDVPTLLDILARQSVAVLVFALVIAAVYRLAMRRVFANGG